MIQIDIRALYTPAGQKYWQYVINQTLVGASIFNTQAEAMNAANEVISHLQKDDPTFGKEVGRDS